MQDEFSVSSYSSLIFRGASFYIIGYATSYLSGFILSILLIRGLGVSSYGIYAFAWMVISFASLFADLGTDRGVVRFVPKYRNEPEKRDAIIGLTYLSVLGTSLLIGFITFIFASHINSATLNIPPFGDVIRIIAIGIPIHSLIMTSSHVFRSLKKVEYQILIKDFITQLAKLGAVGLGVMLGYAIAGVMALLVAGLGVVLLVGVHLLFSHSEANISFKLRKASVHDYFKFSVPLSLSNVEVLLYNNIDVLMIGIFLTSKEVGIYNITAMVAGVVLLPLAGCNQLFAPLASQLYSEGQHDQLDTLYKQVTRWAFVLALLATGGGLIYRTEILGIFSEEVTAGSAVLAVLLVMQLVNVVVGPANNLLMMTDHQYLTVLNNWTAVVLNVVLNYHLVIKWGIIGAAVATGVSIACLNLFRVLEIYWLEGFFPFSAAVLKPMTACGVAWATMYVVSLVVVNFTGVAIGGVTGFLAFAAAMSAMGLDEEDMELLDFLVEKLRA